MNENDASAPTWGRLDKVERVGDHGSLSAPAVVAPSAPEVPPEPASVPPAATWDGIERVVETLHSGAVKETYVATRNGPPPQPREPTQAFRRVTPRALMCRGGLLPD
jgi:hypothetical protein